MKQIRTTLVALAVISLAGAFPAQALSGDASLVFGQRSLDESVLGEASVDDQPLLGVSVTLDVGWPVALAFGVSSSSENGSTAIPGVFPLSVSTDVDTFELDLGVRRYWGERLRWFAGGGLALVELDGTQIERGDFGPGTAYESTIVDDGGSSVGFWVDAGLTYELPRNVNIGFDLRYTDAEVDLTPEGAVGSVGIETSGVQFGATLGYRW